jgi:uncharacterized membrane protein
MNVGLRHRWEIVSSGFWFVPTVMTVAAGNCAFGMLYLDRTYLGSNPIAWLYSGGADGAQTLLSAVAGSTITVAGVVFSITIAALTQASGQFGPRLLRNFMRDFSNQVVLGTFVATFLYCLLVLRTVHGKVDQGPPFVPQASVTGAVLLAAASIAVLIYFIHHVSILLQAPNIVAAVRADFAKVMDDMVEGRSGVVDVDAGPDASPHTLPAGFEADCCPVLSERDGYIQAVDYPSVVAAAEDADVVLRMELRPGAYAIFGNPLMFVSPASRCGSEISKRMNSAFICGNHRTAEQDVEYAIRQIVEIGVRALSPGINDPFTAINCIDALGSVICRVARSGLPSGFRCGPTGKLRLVTPVSTFGGIVATALDQIRQYGRGSVAVTIRLLEVIAECGKQVTDDGQRRVLLEHARMVYRSSQDKTTTPEKADRDDAARRWRTIAETLGIGDLPDDPAGNDFRSLPKANEIVLES